MSAPAVVAAPARRRAAWPGHLGWWALGMAAGAPALWAMRQQPFHLGLMLAAALGLLGAAWLVIDNPAWGACALILIIYWNASDVITDTWGFSWLLRAAIAATGLAWGLQELLRRGRGVWRWPLAAPLAAYGAVQALAAVGAIDRAAAGNALLEYGKAMVVFYLVANLLRTPRVWRWGVNALLAAVVLLGLPVIYQGLSGSANQFWGFATRKYAEIVPGQFGWRLGGAIGDPNFLAMVLVATLPLALVQVFEPGAPLWRRGFAALAAAAALGATFFTYSRAAWLGVGLVAVAMLWKLRRRRGVLAAAAALLLAALTLVPPDTWARLATLGQATQVQAQAVGDESLLVRRNAFLTGMLMFAQHPLLGVGPGNYEANYLHYSALVGLSTETTVRDPHSLPVQIVAETGLAGAVAFGLLLAAAFGLMRRGRRRLRSLGAHRFADLIWALELACAAYLTLSLFLHGAYFRHFLLLLALGALGAQLALPASAPTALRYAAGRRPAEAE